MALFPRKLFNDTLPQIVLKHQLYSLHSDKTRVDKELVWCRNAHVYSPDVGIHKLSCG